jgi:hypothetical protein
MNFKKHLNRVTNIFGVTLKKIDSINTERDYFQNTIHVSKELYKIVKYDRELLLNNQISGMVFSKDRPLQLQALLKSYFKLVSNPAPLNIIYKASTDEIESYYNELMLDFADNRLIFQKENEFRSQLINWLESNKADRIFFLTDDAIFLDEMDMNDCLEFNPIEEVFSFRHGFDLDYSFAFDKMQKIPIVEEKIMNNGSLFYKWRWDNEPDSPDWNYPLSVDGNIFFRKEILLLSNNIIFKNPNSFEANLQVFADFYKCRYGVMYPKVKIVNIPCNLVQNDFSNRYTGHFTADELLLVWKQGRRILFDEFYRLPARVAMYKKYSFYSLS